MTAEFSSTTILWRIKGDRAVIPAPNRQITVKLSTCTSKHFWIPIEGHARHRSDFHLWQNSNQVQNEFFCKAADFRHALINYRQSLSLKLVRGLNTFEKERLFYENVFIMSGENGLKSIPNNLVWSPDQIRESGLVTRSVSPFKGVSLNQLARILMVHFRAEMYSVWLFKSLISSFREMFYLSKLIYRVIRDVCVVRNAVVWLHKTSHSFARHCDALRLWWHLNDNVLSVNVSLFPPNLE